MSQGCHMQSILPTHWCCDVNKARWVWDHPMTTTFQTGPARSMNFGEVPSGRVFSRTLPPQQIQSPFFGHEFWMIRTWWGCSWRIIATVQHHIILSMWTTKKAGRERGMLLSQRNLCLALLFRLSRFSDQPLLLSGTFWCLFSFLTFCSWIQRTTLR